MIKPSKYQKDIYDVFCETEENINIINDRPDVVERLKNDMKKLMEESEAPIEQYERMDL